MVLPDLKEEANRILTETDDRGLRIKLLGGMAIQIALGDDLLPALDRECGDIDLFTTKQHGSAVETMLEEMGWEPESQFNAINGAHRLLFDDPESGRKIDVFIDRFEMCHSLPLDRRFDLPGPTLTPAELLLTKLQIIELNEKDRGDAYALLFGFPITDSDPAGMEIGLITDLASGDWGLQHTLELNFERLKGGLAQAPLSEDEAMVVSEAIDQITAALEAAPKSRGWKLRAKIGERKRWYDEPEEI